MGRREAEAVGIVVGKMKFIAMAEAFFLKWITSSISQVFMVYHQTPTKLQSLVYSLATAKDRSYSLSP